MDEMSLPFPSRYLEIPAAVAPSLGGVGRLRVHYVEGGQGRPILFLHGNPTAAFLWRGALPTAARHGRAIAFDLLGHGLSDKPDIAYTFEDHAAVLRAVADALEVDDAVLVLHDWGGPLGFHWALEHPARVRAIAAMESFPWRLSWSDFPPAFRRAFRLFRAPWIGALLLQHLNLFVEWVLPAASARRDALSPDALATYRSFYPTAASRRAIRRWPQMLPIDPGESTYATLADLESRLPRLGVPLLWLYATPGAITTPARLEWLRKNVATAELRSVGQGGHYLPEEVPEAIAEALDEWLPRVLGPLGPTS
jgi:pimeloyl-ACP methyl ester carboxylesterase